MHLSVLGQMLTVVAIATTVHIIPRPLLVLLVMPELILLSGALGSDLLEIDGEGVPARLERPHREVMLRDHDLFCLSRFGGLLVLSGVRGRGEVEWGGLDLASFMIYRLRFFSGRLCCISCLERL